MGEVDPTEPSIRRMVLTGRAPALSVSLDTQSILGACVVDLSDLEFATPLDLVGIASLLASASDPAKVLIIPPRRPHVANYLLRMDLMAVMPAGMRIDPEFPTETPRPDTPGLIALTRVQSVRDVQTANEGIFGRLKQELPLRNHLAVFEIIAELLENASTHGACPSGAFLAAQYYTGRTSGMPPGFWIAVADAGIGIQSSLANNPEYQGLDDVGAIRAASRVGVSGITESGRGLGLSDIRSRAGAARSGQVVTFSGVGESRFFVGPTGTTARYRTRQTPVPGTWTLALAGTAKPRRRP